MLLSIDRLLECMLKPCVLGFFLGGDDVTAAATATRVVPEAAAAAALEALVCMGIFLVKNNGHQPKTSYD